MATKMVNDERVGFQTEGYIDNKGTPSGDGAKFNELPPGQNIADQSLADIRDLPMKIPETTGYGDGWNSN